MAKRLKVTLTYKLPLHRLYITAAGKTTEHYIDNDPTTQQTLFMKAVYQLTGRILTNADINTLVRGRKVALPRRLRFR